MRTVAPRSTNFLLNGDLAHVIDGVIRFEPNAPLRIPIAPCSADGCPLVIPPELETSVYVLLPFAAATRIVDDAGRIVRKSRAGEATSLRFHPSPDFSYRSPGAALQRGSAPVYRGRQYFLEIVPHRLRSAVRDQSLHPEYNGEALRRRLRRE